MIRVYIGNLDARVSKQELDDEFRIYGIIRRIWVARKPLGYAFIDFDDHRDAQDAIRDLNGKHKQKAELSSYSRSGGDYSGCDSGSREFGRCSGRRCS